MKNFLPQIGFFLLLIVYALTHFIQLDVMPVFADEAIYIRWAQLIIDDASRYAFFPLNDGKTPLFIWLLVPFQFLFANQLVAARFVSALVGLAQLGVFWWISSSLKLTKLTKFVGSVWFIALPFWYFHHRLALIDGLLTLWISIGTVLVWKLITSLREHSPAFKQAINLKSFVQSSPQLFTSIILGVVLALALLTKVPAILAIPGMFLGIFLLHGWVRRFQALIYLGLSQLVALLFFLLLRLHPAFPQLFSRGGDFLFPLSEVLAGKWQITIQQWPTYFHYFYTYLGPVIFIFLVLSLFYGHHKRTAHYFFWSGLLFIGPIALMGQVVYPRYLFPAAWYFTMGAVLGLEYIVTWVKVESNFHKKLIGGLTTSLLIANSFIPAVGFVSAQLNDPLNTPYVAPDQQQYVTEWSMGQGVYEAAQLVQAQAQHSSIALATEGYFGTLPDGILLYLHGQDVTDIYVEGIGQPVRQLPAEFIARAKEYDRTWLLVNNQRLSLDLPSQTLVDEWCVADTTAYEPSDRCLQLWDITQLVWPR